MEQVFGTQRDQVLFSRLGSLDDERVSSNRVANARVDNRTRLERAIKALPSSSKSHFSETLEKANLLRDALSRGGGARRVVQQPPSKTADFCFGKYSPGETWTERQERQEQERNKKREKMAAKATKRAELLRCRCFLGHCAAINFAHTLCEALKQSREEKSETARYAEAQKRIARFYKSKALTEKFKVAVALAHIQSLAFGVKMHIRRRKTAIRRIRTFFFETKRLHQVMVAKKKICGSVRLLQRATRDYRACTAARLKCIGMLWDIVAAESAASIRRAELDRAAAEAAADENKLDLDTADAKNSPLFLRRKYENDADAQQMMAVVARRQSHGSITKAKVRQLEWRAKRKDLEIIARDKLRRKQLRDFEASCNRAWQRIDSRIDKVRTKLVASKVVPPQSKYKVEGPSAAPTKFVPLEMRTSLILELLVRIRRGHQNRWAEEALRVRFREASKTYSTVEAKNILQMKYPSVPPVPVRAPDRRLKEWPVLPFFLPKVDLIPIGNTPPLPERLRLKDVVSVVYVGALEEIDDQPAASSEEPTVGASTILARRRSSV